MNVLGVRRKKEYLLPDLGNERIHSGDVLLVQGTWNNIARLSRKMLIGLFWDNLWRKRLKLR